MAGMRRVHAATGVALGLYVVVHLVSVHLATARAPAAVDGERKVGASAALGLAVLGLLLVHGWLGLRRPWRAAEGAASRRPAGWSPRAQLATGLGVLLFFVVHLATVIGPGLAGAHGSAQTAAWLERLLSTSSAAVPAWGMAYVVGVCVVAAHWGHGLWASAARLDTAASPRQSSRLAWLFGLAAMALGVLGGDAVVRIATGSGVDWPWLAPRTSAADAARADCGASPAAAPTSAGSAPGLAARDGGAPTPAPSARPE